MTKGAYRREKTFQYFVSFPDLYQTLVEALLPPMTVSGDDRSDFDQLQAKLDSAKQIHLTIQRLESSEDFLALHDLETR